MRWIHGYLVAGLVSLIALALPGDRPTFFAAWSLVVAVGAASAVLVGLRLHRPPERLPWQLLAASACVAAVALVGLAAPARLPLVAGASVTEMLLLVGPMLVACALAVFVRRGTPARDVAALVDTGIVMLGAGSLAWLVVLQPIVDDPARPPAERGAAVTSVVVATLLVGLGARLLLSAAVVMAERWLIGGAVTAQSAGLYLLPLDSVAGLQVVQVSAVALLAGHLLFGAAALHPGMWWLTQPGRTAEPWPTRRRLAVLAPAALVPVALVGYEVLVAGQRTGVVPELACVALAALLVTRLVELAAGRDRVSDREETLQAASAALAVARDRSEIRQAAVHAATELAGGVRQAYVDVDLSSRPQLDVQNGAVVGTGEIAAALRGQIRQTGSLARTGAARTIVAPVIVRGRLQGVVRVTGMRPLAWHLEQSLGLLAGQAALALEGLEVADDLAERRSEARFRSLVQNSNDLIVVLETDLTIRYATPSASTLLGTEPADLVGERLDDRFHSDERDHALTRLRDDVQTEGSVTHELRLRRADGVWRTFEVTISDLRTDPAVGGLVLTGRDVSERQALEEELTRQAFHDGLTGLANRALLADRVKHALVRAARNHAHVAVMFLDVDDFKTINDSLGHEAGDEMLVELAARLRRCMRGSDTAARLGGDEFALVLEETNGVEGAAAFAERVLAAIGAPLTVGGALVNPRASIGITFGTAGQSPGELLRNADVAMYQAKRTGGGRYELYDPHMHEAALARLELKADLERAFRADELDVAYQPIVDLDTGITEGLEALLRWTHPVRGPISPAEFVPLAEETGLISELGHWVLVRACRQVREWQQAVPGCDRLSANVNLSARQVLEPGLRERIARVLRETGLEARSLVLEITESSMMEDVAGVTARLAELRADGIRIAIDDFGTGFSSLGYLQRFPVDELKIAKEFVDDMVFNARNARLVEGIVKLGAALDLRTLAEGIETMEQRRRLHAMGCELGQGYLFARPAAAAQVPALLQRSAVAAA